CCGSCSRRNKKAPHGGGKPARGEEREPWGPGNTPGRRTRLPDRPLSLPTRQRAAEIPARAGKGAMRLFVTGATGYIGRQLCRRLLIDGHEVRAIVRRPERGAALAAAGVAMFPGDVTDRASMREAMSGADAVLHAAADLDLSGPPGRMEAVNVGGSENVATLAGRFGVPRLLSVASMACFGGSP